MLTPKLDSQLGLHVEVSIIYVVTGFQAILFGRDARTLAEGDVKKTVGEALQSLEDKA